MKLLRFGNELTVYLDKLEGKRQEPRKAIQLSKVFERKLHCCNPLKQTAIVRWLCCS